MRPQACSPKTKREAQGVRSPSTDPISHATTLGYDDYRDAASKCFKKGKHGFAQTNRERKESLYDLKDVAVAWLAHYGHIVAEQIHGALCLWVGLGYSFHSTLTPGNVEHAVDDAPLTIEAKPKGTAEMRLIDAEHLLESLPDWGAEYDRLLVPQFPRAEREVICNACGEEGHVASECPNMGDED